MKVLIVLSLALLGVVLGQAQGDQASLDEVYKNPRSGRIVYERPMIRFPPTVGYACKSLAEALRLHDFANALRHFNRKSIILSNSRLPAGGVYKGKRGAVEFGVKLAQTAIVTSESYEIKHIDEAQGICILDCHTKGTFRRNNNSLDVRHTNFIKFDLGRVRVWNVVDRDFNKTITSFQTKAENKFDQVLNAFFGASPAAMEQFIADDCEVQLPNLYPSTLISDRQRQVEGKNVSFMTRGKEGLQIFASLAESLIVNRTLDVKYLYGNETSVISAWALKPKLDFEMWNLKSKKMAAKVLTVMYVCADFNEKGLMKSFKALFNRPFLPWQTYQFGVELKKVGELKGVVQNATKLAAAPLSAPSATGIAAAPVSGPTAAPLAAPIAATGVQAGITGVTGVQAGITGVQAGITGVVTGVQAGITGAPSVAPAAPLAQL